MDQYEQLSEGLSRAADCLRALEANSKRWPGHDYPYDSDLPDDILDDSDFLNYCADRIAEDREQFEWADKLAGVIWERFNCSYDPEDAAFIIGDEDAAYSGSMRQVLLLLHRLYPAKKRS